MADGDSRKGPGRFGAPSDAPVILSDVPGSFTWKVLHERHPALIQKVRDATPYDPERLRALDLLLGEITEGVIIVPMSFRTASYGDSAFVSGWTIFYWAWWISWAPFVGVFIARISRGRTIREFVFGVILAPSIVSFVWFAVLGGAAINLQLTGAANISKLAAANPPAALFATLQQFPLFWLTAIIAIILVALFFISGADAASVVMGMLSTRGDLHPKAWTVIVWGVFTGSAAAVCLLAGAIQGSVDAALLALQSVAIASAAPFVLILIGLCFSIMKALRAEQPVAAPGREAPEPGRASSRPTGTAAPQQMSAENPEEQP